MNRWGHALYVFSPGTDGKNFELAPPGLCGEIDSAMAGAESRPPEREKNRGEARPSKARFFSRPSSAPVNSFFANPIGQSPFLHTLSVTDGEKVRFWHTFSVTDGEKIHATPPPRPRKETVYFLSYGRGKSSFLHTLSVTDGKNNALGWYFFGARFCRSALGRRPPRSDPKNLRREKKALEREVFPDRAGVHFSFFSCGDT